MCFLSNKTIHRRKSAWVLNFINVCISYCRKSISHNKNSKKQVPNFLFFFLLKMMKHVIGNQCHLVWHFTRNPCSKHNLSSSRIIKIVQWLSMATFCEDINCFKINLIQLKCDNEVLCSIVFYFQWYCLSTFYNLISFSLRNCVILCDKLENYEQQIQSYNLSGTFLNIHKF
jgi:hypothetical protein